MTLLYLLAFLLLEPVKRLLSPVLYPLAYVLRKRLRDTSAPLWLGYLYCPSGILAGPLWLLLDDSLMFSQSREFDNKESRYPSAIWSSGSDFLKAWWWASVRNSFVNWNNLCAYSLGAFDKELAHYGSSRNFYKVRRYANGVRPYCEFYVFGRWNQVGWLSGGAPRFEIDILKKRG